MHIIILTEGGKNKGFGHVARCSSIYHAFKIKGFSAKLFINGDESLVPIFNNLKFSIKDWIKELPLIKHSDIVIIDSYLADENLYQKIFEKCGLLVSFDDDNRINYPGGIVVNGNVLSQNINYPSTSDVTYLLGSKYSTLKREYWDISPININNCVQNILVTLGGDDIRNLTPNILKLLNYKFPNLIKNVIVGKSFSCINEIEGIVDDKTHLIYSPNSKKMLEVMLKSDIAISAGGQTTYEFARIGLPSIAISIADNQTDSILNWEKLGFLEFAGLWNEDNLLYNISNKLDKLMDFEYRKIKHDNGILLIDGLGANRVVDSILDTYFGSNILITSASRKVSLVRNFKRALEGNGKIFAADIDSNSPALYFADDYLMVPRSDDPNFINFIIDFCKKEDIKLIIPTRDEELILFSKNKKLFDEIGINVMVSEVETIEICQDKEKFINFCENNGFGIPKTYKNLDSIKKEDFPLFLKPVIGKSGNDTFKVDSFEELTEILIKDNEFIIQECVEAPEYTIDLFADFKGNVISAIPRQRIYVWGGESLVTKTVKNEKIINESVRLAQKLKLKGHNTIQCFFDGKNIKFIEINPRFGGAASISFEAGANSAEFLIKLINNEDLEPMIGKFKDNFVSLRFVEDYFIDGNDLEE